VPDPIATTGLGLGSLRDEHQLGAWPVGSVTNAVQRESVRGQVVSQLGWIAESKGGVRGEQRPVGIEDVVPTERDERKGDLGHLTPRRHVAASSSRGGPAGALRRPLAPRLPPRITDLEDQPASRAQRSVARRQTLVPLVLGDEHLGDVRGHRDQIDRCPVIGRSGADKPSNTIGERLGPSDCYRRFGGIDSGDVKTATRQLARKHTRSASNIQHGASANFAGDREVELEIVPMSVQRVVDRSQPGQRETGVNHPRESPTPAATTTARGSRRADPGISTAVPPDRSPSGGRNATAPPCDRSLRGGGWDYAPSVIELQPMTHDDLGLVARWLLEPRVARWWLAGTTVEAELDELRMRVTDAGDPATRMLTIFENDEHTASSPIGWCQWYPYAAYPPEAAAIGARADDHGIDYAIGDASAVGRGLGTELISVLVGEVRRQQPRSGLLVAPDSRNVASRRVLERNGFSLIEVRPISTEPTRDPMAIYRLDAPARPSDES